ncbi:hypothetical protein N0V88_002006 [Collariella sp. IMI 366227]|nr:hypothetical protein N0V88_002006 [Collariella sp. IMI 366227]
MAEPFAFEPLSCNGEENDDLDSLFGGGDDDADLTSLFTDVAAVEPPQEPDCEPISVPPQELPQHAANPVTQLHFLEVQVQAQTQVPSVPQLSLPTVPDPPRASLSHRIGHTSGDTVVSTHASDSSTPGLAITAALDEGSLDDAALEAELLSLWESTTGKDQPVNTQAGSQSQSNGPPEDDDISTTQIPGFRYAYSQTNSIYRVSRRSDQDVKAAEELTYYVTFNRSTKIEVLYQYLELDVGEGKRLSGEIRLLLKDRPFNRCVEQRKLSSACTKRLLIRMAFCVLVDKGWGHVWFGDGCRTAQSRTLFWPRDSTVLLTCFTMLLYRLFNCQRQMYLATLRAQDKIAPLDSRSRSATSRSPSLTPSLPASTTAGTPPPTPEGQEFFDALVKDVVSAKKRKLHESTLGLTKNQAFELEVPANARLKYHIYLINQVDGSALGPPTTYRHNDYMIARGAFSSLNASLEAAGMTPHIEIHTRRGRKVITSETEWEQAVLQIYNVRRSGGVVEVDVFV